MKKLLSLLLALAMVLSIIPFAMAEDFNDLADEASAGEEEVAVLTPLEIALNYRPVSEEPTHITIGNPTKVRGSFFTSYFGNNTSDIDVRTMIHGYSPVVWENQLEFVEDPMVVENISRTVNANGVTFTVTLARDLLYNDGETPLTAQDFVFAWLLSCSPQLAAIGADTPKVDVLGFDAFHSGETQVLSGVRLLGDYAFSVTFTTEYETYFYDYSRLALNPCPVSVIAPGCTVRDSGLGAYLEGDFTSRLLEETILNPETGYASHPALTCGPYRLTAYDAQSGVVEFELNPYYKGNSEGVKPVIDSVTLVPVDADTMVRRLESGEVDALNKCVDQSAILGGMQLIANGEGFSMTNYARTGYGFCAFSCEQGPQQFQAVRQALNYAFDSEAFIRDFLGGFGVGVYGYYGIGQWMVGAANGTLRPEELTEEQEAEWDALNLDVLNTYEFDLDEANRLLDEDGWTLNASGEAYNPEQDSLRYKMVDGALMPLSLRFAKSANNPSADMVVALYAESLPQIGAALEVEEVSFDELLADYYREEGVRRFDMNFMATNFISTFDPYLTFLGRDDMQGAVNTSGIVDEELVRLAFEMRSTEPGDLLTFEQRWLAMQQRYNELLPTMPIYSNVYFDFHTDWLQNYYPNSQYSWPVALLYAFYGEPPAEEETEDEFAKDDLLADAFEIDYLDVFTDATLPSAVTDAPEAEGASASPAVESENLTIPATAETPVAAVASSDAFPIEITVKATQPPKDGIAYRPGEVINLLISVVNHGGNSLRGVSLKETLAGKYQFWNIVSHGESKEYLVGYRITEEDAANGSVHEEVSFSCVSSDGTPITATAEISLPTAS